MEKFTCLRCGACCRWPGAVKLENAEITGTVNGLANIAASTDYTGKVFSGTTITGGTVTEATAVSANAAGLPRDSRA